MTNSIKSATQKFLPTRLVELPKALNDLESAKEEYLEEREKLRVVHDRRRRLSIACQERQKEGESAGEKWRSRFRQCDGQATKDVRSFQEEERVAAAEVEQLNDLLGEVDPILELHRMQTYGARIAYERACSAALKEMHFVSAEGALTDLGKEKSAGLSASLPALMMAALDEVVGDVVFMATLAMDTASAPGYDQMSAILPSEAREAVNRKATDLLLKWIGAMVISDLPDMDDPAGSDHLTDDLKLLPSADFEADRGELPTGLGFRRKLTELQNKVQAR